MRPDDTRAQSNGSNIKKWKETGAPFCDVVGLRVQRQRVGLRSIWNGSVLSCLLTVLFFLLFTLGQIKQRQTIGQFGSSCPVNATCQTERGPFIVMTLKRAVIRLDFLYLSWFPICRASRSTRSKDEPDSKKRENPARKSGGSPPPPRKNKTEQNPSAGDKRATSFFVNWPPPSPCARRRVMSVCLIFGDKKKTRIFFFGGGGSVLLDATVTRRPPWVRLAYLSEVFRESHSSKISSMGFFMLFSSF